METIKKIAIICLILSILFGFLAYVVGDKDEIKEVNCYDRYGNKIIGEVCEEEISNGFDELVFLCSLSIISFILMVIGIMLRDSSKS